MLFGSRSAFSEFLHAAMPMATRAVSIMIWRNRVMSRLPQFIRSRSSLGAPAPPSVGCRIFCVRKPQGIGRRRPPGRQWTLSGNGRAAIIPRGLIFNRLGRGEGPRADAALFLFRPRRRRRGIAQPHDVGVGRLSGFRDHTRRDAAQIGKLERLAHRHELCRPIGCRRAIGRSPGARAG